jgi:outer membrane protein
MLITLKPYCFCLTLLMTTAVSAQNLEDIYQQVLQSDPRLLIDSLGVEVGIAREQQAYGALLPQVSISGSWTENDRAVEGFADDSYSGERHTLSVRQPLIDMPKYYNWKRSKDESSRFEFQQKETQSAVRLDTIERYFQLLSATDELALIREERAATEKKVEQTQALYLKQRVKVTDLYEVEARLDRLVSEEIDAMQVTDLAKEGLNELTNSPIVIEHISPLIETVSYIQRVENRDDWAAGSLIANASLMALQKSIDAAKKNVKQQSAGHYPLLDLQLSQQQSTIGFENSELPSTTTGVISLSLTVPLFSGGQTTARTREASQQLALARATYDQEQRKITKQLGDMFLSVNAMVRRIEAADKAIKSAKKSYQAMNNSFELGIATVSDVLDTQHAYSQAKRKHQQAKYDYIIHKARLFHVSGKLDDNNFYTISKWLM